MSGNVTYAIELGVGLGCLVAAGGAWRSAGRARWVALVLLAAGVAAIVHALSELLG